MTTDDPVFAGQAIVAGLKKAGIDFVATLPDEKMLEVIRAVERDRELKHIPLCREEEGIGICAGAYLAGKKTAIIMQNAGFLNSCNALTTTSLQLQIPILMLIYYAGDIGDRGFTTLGSVTEPVLQAMDFAAMCCASRKRSMRPWRARRFSPTTRKNRWRCSLPKAYSE
jgi:sulfopyruvate decarboxylase subunit alpha